MTIDECREIARAAIERNIGNLVDEETSIDMVYDEAFTLAVDALLDKGIPKEVAHPIAVEEAMKLCQP